MKRNLIRGLAIVLSLGQAVSAFAVGDVPPQPQPQPQPPAHVPNLDQARADGRADGPAGGDREGRERGAAEGTEHGQESGYNEGYQEGYQKFSKAAYDDGYADGYRQGDYEGQQAGYGAGDAQGRIDGNNDGTADGQHRADVDAQRASAAPGRAKGIDEANHSDAVARGTADGTVKGDNDAHETALNYDYPRGRKAYNDERFAEPVQSNDEIDQHPATARLSLLGNASSLSLKEQLVADREDHDGDNDDPDYRYRNYSRSYQDPSETAAYQQAYNEAYAGAFRSSFRAAFQQTFGPAHEAGEERGWAVARQQDYGAFHQNGWQEGHQRGYSEAYARAYKVAHDGAYNRVFPGASQSAYQVAYPDRYAVHFEEARQAAYSAHVDELYQSAFEAARQRKYNEVYPGYAEQQYQRGRQDEAADFKLRPLRLTDTSVIETLGSGVYQPGEELRLRLSLRNFSDSALAGKDVRIQIRGADNWTVIAEGDATVVKDVRRRSLTAVTNAMSFHFTEAGVNRPSQVFVSVTYQGRDVGQQTLTLTPQFMLRMSLAEQPVLKEGMPAPVRLSVTNQSGKTTDSSLRIQLVTDPSKVELKNAVVNVGAIPAGETRVLEYTVIGRTADYSVNLPLAFKATIANGRRIGLLDLSGEIPVANDYRITLAGSVANLRNAGVTRATYSLVNVNSRLVLSDLQLVVRVLDNAGNVSDAFSIIGPNPQYVLPIENGRRVQFVVPILAKAANAGGVLELEVHESGTTVVVHREQF